jgi:hypothetical protein
MREELRGAKKLAARLVGRCSEVGRHGPTAVASSEENQTASLFARKREEDEIVKIQREQGGELYYEGKKGQRERRRLREESRDAMKSVARLVRR